MPVASPPALGVGARTIAPAVPPAAVSDEAVAPVAAVTIATPAPAPESNAPRALPDSLRVERPQAQFVGSISVPLSELRAIPAAIPDFRFAAGPSIVEVAVDPATGNEQLPTSVPRPDRGETPSARLGASEVPGDNARGPATPAAPPSPVVAAASAAPQPPIPVANAAPPIVQAMVPPPSVAGAPAASAPALPMPPAAAIVTHAPAAAAPALPPAPKREATRVAITVASPARAAQPAAAQQPAAQVFAAAMFAAERPPTAVRDASPADVAASFPPSAVAPTAAPVAVVAVGASPQPALDLARGDWMGSMIERIETIRDDAGVRETRIRLTPDALGSVDVSIGQDEAGVLQVRFDADTAQTRAILAEAAPRLAEMAEARGLKLAGAGVDSGAHPGQRHAQQASAPATVRSPSAANDDTDTLTDTRIA